MPEIPEWLPNMIAVDGEWEKVVEALYTIFSDDMVAGKPKLDNCHVWWDRRVLEGDKYEEGFWHLISKDDNETRERLFDSRRAERLPWCRPCIDNFRDRALKFWNYRISENRIETYLWLEEFDYVVIFQKKSHRIGTVYFLLTAYYVEGDTTRRRLRRKYENRQI